MVHAKRRPQVNVQLNKHIDRLIIWEIKWLLNVTFYLSLQKKVSYLNMIGCLYSYNEVSTREREMIYAMMFYSFMSETWYYIHYPITNPPLYKKPSQTQLKSTYIKHFPTTEWGIQRKWKKRVSRSPSAILLPIRYAVPATDILEDQFWVFDRSLTLLQVHTCYLRFLLQPHTPSSESNYACTSKCLEPYKNTITDSNYIIHLPSRVCSQFGMKGRG